jgi:hypothetical protein
VDFRQAKFLRIHKVNHMAEGKTIGAWLSGNDLDKAEQRAKKVAKGNNSLYVKQLILADLAGSGPDLSEGTDVIVKLARHYHPTLADTLAQQLTFGDGATPANQARVIVRILDALNRALEVGDFNPEKDFEIADRAKIQAWENLSETRMGDLAAALAQHLRPAEHLALVAEDQAPFEIKPGTNPKKTGGKKTPKFQPPDGHALIREATSKPPASSSKSKAS